MPECEADAGKLQHYVLECEASALDKSIEPVGKEATTMLEFRATCH
jgi:hypothetical protein